MKANNKKEVILPGAMFWQLRPRRQVLDLRAANELHR